MRRSIRTWNYCALVALLAAILAACQSLPADDQRPRPPADRTALPTAPIVPTATAVSDSVLTTPEPTSPSTTALPALTATPQPAAFFDPQRLAYEPQFYSAEIQAFLDAQPGTLKNQSFLVGDRRHSLAEVLVGQTSYYGLNPRVILALLESQNGLISNPAPTSDQLGWAIGFDGNNGNWRGLRGQIQWAVKQSFYARRDFPQRAPLTYADNSIADPPANWGLSEYVLGRILAPTTRPGNVTYLMQRFQESYTRLFGDPRLPPQGWPGPAEPFLQRPLEKTVPVSSFYDHDAPFLARNPAGSVMTYWGRDETDNSFAYDGHDGWDYAAAPPDRVLAAAAGMVVFAGNADDGCATRAVVIDHQNGYRTLYWHLAQVNIEIGQSVQGGEDIGMVGNSGCSLGPHLHFGTQYLGHGVDPYGWCGTGIDPWAANPSGGTSTWLWADRPSPCGAPPAGAIVVDAGSQGFYRAGDGWEDGPSGYGDGASFVASVRGSNEREGWRLRPMSIPAVAVWKAQLPKAGRYRVLAYVPYALSGLEDPRRTEYRVRHADGESTVVVNARTYANDWADLGTYSFNADDENGTVVVLSNQCEEARLSVWADAVMWIPVTSAAL